MSVTENTRALNEIILSTKLFLSLDLTKKKKHFFLLVLTYDKNEIQIIHIIIIKTYFIRHIFHE